jgi:hypothetical protein
MASKNLQPLVSMTAKNPAPSFHDAEVTEVMGDLSEWNNPGCKLLTQKDLEDAVSMLVIPLKD